MSANDSYVFGKIQPQAIPLEEAVLGALMLDRDCLASVIDTLSIESFYLESHQHIYRAIISLFNSGSPVDLLTVTEEVRKLGVLEKCGGPFYLVELSNRVASAANIEAHARYIQEKWMQRKLIEAGTGILSDAYSDTKDIFEMIGDAEKSILNITSATSKKDANNAYQIAMKVLKNTEAATQKRKDGGITGVPTGLYEIDRHTGGLQKSDLIILAARPGQGKTGLAMTIAHKAAQSGFPVGIFSLEMSETQLMARVIGGESGVSSNRMQNGDVSDYDLQKLQTTIERMDNLPLYIDDTPAIGILSLRSKARRMKTKYDVKLIIVDYLQLMKSSLSVGTTNDHVSDISKGLKALAKELDVPVIALSQLSRAVETRGGSKRPQLSDLRDSGSIEQDADIVGFIYRPEYYSILEDENGRSLKGVAEIIFAKHRNGPTGTVEVRFEEQFAKFSDLEPQTPTIPLTKKNGEELIVPYNPSAGITANRSEDVPF